MRNMLLAWCYILAMVNLVIWSAVYGNLTHSKSATPIQYKSQQFNYHPQPVWI